LNVQQVTSSIVYSSGSNIFGNSLSNTQQFTGSVSVTGSLTVTTAGTELQVTSTGVNLGNALTDSHIISGSLRVNPNGLFVSGSGNVGIGTTSPTLALNVIGQVRAGYATNAGLTIGLAPSGVPNNDLSAYILWGDNATFGGNNGDLIYIPRSSTTGEHRFYTANTGLASEKMRITYDGNVGIGTTSPGYRLSVQGTSNSGIFVKQGSQISDAPSSGSFYSGLTFENISTTNAWSIGYSQGAKFSINYFDASSTYTRVLTATGGGNVGIGTINPSVRLSGRVLSINDTSANLQSSIELLRNGASSGEIFVNSDNMVIGSFESDIPLTFRTQNNERMRITSGGNILIGTTTDPGNKLYVSGSIKATNGFNFPAFAGISEWQIGSDSVTGTGLYLYNSGVGYSMRLTPAGAVTFLSSVASGGWISVPNNFGLEARNAANTAGRVVIKLNTSNQIEIGRDTDISAVILGTTTEHMRITSGGNVGIGLTTPQYRLHVTNSDTLEGTIAIGNSLYPGLIYSSASTGEFRIDNRSSAGVGFISFYPNGQTTIGNERMRITAAGTVQPGANGTQDLGTSSLRWATVFTSDLSLSNGIGDYTIVEGENDLFLYNNKQNKVYKFVIEEVDPSTATPKKS
jgi:hypothetical protein